MSRTWRQSKMQIDYEVVFKSVVPEGSGMGTPDATALRLRLMIRALLQINSWNHFRMRRCGMTRPGKRSNSGNGPVIQGCSKWPPAQPTVPQDHGYQRGQAARLPTTEGAKVEERVPNSPHQSSYMVGSPH